MTMTETNERATSAVLPPDVCLSPKCLGYLERAVSCLRGGLLVSAWHWTAKAYHELERLTNGTDAEFLVTD